MKKVKIAFFDSKPYDRIYFDRNVQDYPYEIKYFAARLNKDTAGLAKDAQVVCAFVNDTIDQDTVKVLKDIGVELIALRCAGYNNVDLKAVYKNIHVVRVPAYSPYAVAEHAMALILALNRKIHKAYYRTRDNNFTINGLMGFDLHGKVAGVIGTGRIGQVMVDILKGFGIEVLLYDPYPDQNFAKERGVKYVELDELYQRSDIITLHCPLTKETVHLLDEDSLDKMKDGVMIINTSRGKLIDSKALIKGLKSDKIGFAGLDVYEEEADYFFEDFSAENVDDDVLARLITFNNVLITSHQAFFTREAMDNISRTTLENIKEYYQTDNLSNEICYKCNEGACRKEEKGRCF